MPRYQVAITAVTPLELVVDAATEEEAEAAVLTRLEDHGFAWSMVTDSITYEDAEVFDAWEGAELTPEPSIEISPILDRSDLDRARRAAKRVGWRVVKARGRQHLSNRGGLMLVDEKGVVDGANYDLSPHDVLDRCAQEQRPAGHA